MSDSGIEPDKPVRGDGEVVLEADTSLEVGDSSVSAAVSVDSGLIHTLRPRHAVLAVPSDTTRHLVGIAYHQQRQVQRRSLPRTVSPFQ